MRMDPKPKLVAHADWSKYPRKRWCATAVLDADGRYRIESPEPVGDLATYFGRLQNRAGADTTVLSGFDFPIGLPVCYADRVGLADFRTALTDFGRGRWRHFYDPAPLRSALSLTRPFYPQKPGGAKHQHLVDALEVRTFRELYRRCDRCPGRDPAEAIFWLLGPKQVGRAAISGWRDLLRPAMSGDSPPAIWPFDGCLTELLKRPGMVVAETYPAEMYRHLNLTIGRSGRSKRRATDRAQDAAAMHGWARTNHVRLTSELHAEISDGFRAGKDGDDRFDAIVGLFGMLDVVLGNLPSGEPEDDTTKIEGWILGRSCDTPSARGEGEEQATRRPLRAEAQSELDQLNVALRSSEEPFRGEGASLRLLDYWRWSGSSLMDNTARGMLAEFLVATAVGKHETPRLEWERFDLITPSGVTIEVKSAAAIQTWRQTARTPIQFAIGPRQGWDPETGLFSEQARRWADLYVFCVLEGVHPLDVDKWQFYVLPRAVLDDKCREQRTIRLGPLEQLKPCRCSYRDLKRTIEDVGRQIARGVAPERED